ncbi:MAG: undecaprenyl-diphosphate phosphatase [Gammaproteobacteria bacterium]|nr:undecaprenyl-diphosphate phosphatase [Gammaproteobacteria bacterium]MDH4313605.1 undecaprenyl-diphosphate phosphatase [Gammaproteobacteria bacterium]MDH5213344.1 undecaprenyl-diphosphate phosphatase [Gammaproteobacteria bacterium]MDH5502349.1 undecaprenyl-diphosphate phosphatase [Gammaproteobacteria bacterium]
MSLIQIIVLAVVQGLTEFLPISSSGHLVLVPGLLNWSDQGLEFDVAVHFGSLLAVVVYFRNDIGGLLKGAMEILQGRTDTLRTKMVFVLAIGTVPAAIAGLTLAGWIEENLRSPAVVAATLAGYGILLGIADIVGRKQRVITDVGLKEGLVIGIAQALSLVPGTSRSGITITAGLLLGFRRQDAARFSFLLAVPVILLAAMYEFATLIMSNAPVAWGELTLAALISAVVAYLSIEFFMRFVNAIGLVPFAIYRVILAAVICYVLVL